MCMKRKFIMLSLLITRPRQHEYDLDVYLAPLIDGLKAFWNVGVETYDAFKKKTFNLWVVLIWTISDFLAYGNLLGCTVKGYYTSLICGLDKKSQWLTCSKKCVFLGHHQFLPHNHSFRLLKKVFNKKTEWNEPKKALSSQDI